ncbi:MAG: hypothetical protein HQ538_03470 [Parcubacteria group bacterium]|nr:hypothetical protein [Parcubacteria group bacterium]
MKYKSIVLKIIFIFFLMFGITNIVQASVLGFDTSDPCEYWDDVFNFSMSAAGILTLVMLVAGGLYYIVSLGQEERLGNAKKIMTGAMSGFGLAIFSYLIFNILSPSLLRCEIYVPEVQYPDFGNADEETTAGGDTSDGVTVNPGTGSGLYSEMMAACPSDRSNSSNHLENYRNVINRWMSIIPGRAVYVGGGYMSGGTCNASPSDPYLTRKLQSGRSYSEQWVDPVGGDMNQAISNYREWARGLGGTYCGDCLTFSRTLYQCVANINVIPIKANRGSATYYFNSPSEFANALQNGTVQMTPGSFIWLGTGCGHAINYTGVSGAEVIEMGGGGSPVTANGHRASTVNVTSSLQGYLSSGWVRARDCPVYVHRPLE